MNRLPSFFILLLFHSTNIFSQLSEFKIKESNVPINWKEELIARGSSSQTKIGSFCESKVFNIINDNYIKSKTYFTDSILTFTKEQFNKKTIQNAKPIKYLENGNIYLRYDSIIVGKSRLPLTKAFEIIYWSGKMIIINEVSTSTIDINTGRRLTSTEIQKKEEKNYKDGDMIMYKSVKQKCNKKFAPQVEIIMWE
jgi:hypothetical protein